MKILITGICGFVGSTLAEALLARAEGITICGIDNLMRPGSEMNRVRLRTLGVEFVHGDIRAWSDMAAMPEADWVIDAAANPSVLAGVGGGGSSRQLFEHNLAALGNVLGTAKRTRRAVAEQQPCLSIPALAGLPLLVRDDAFRLNADAALPAGVSADGIGVGFSTQAPVALRRDEAGDGPWRWSMARRSIPGVGDALRSAGRRGAMARRIRASSPTAQRPSAAARRALHRV